MDRSKCSTTPTKAKARSPASAAAHRSPASRPPSSPESPSALRCTTSAAMRFRAARRRASVSLRARDAAAVGTSAARPMRHSNCTSDRKRA